MDRERLKALGWLVAATLFFLFLGYNTIMETETRATILTADTLPLHRIAADPAPYTGETINVSGRIQLTTTLAENLPDHTLREGNTTLPVTQCPTTTFRDGDDVLLTTTVTNQSYNRTLSPDEVIDRAETTNTTFDRPTSVQEPAYNIILECEQVRERLSERERDDTY